MTVDYSVRQEIKQWVRKRDDFKCVVCGDTEIQVHHVEFLSRGGEDSPENCVSLCEKHHSGIHTGDMEIVEFEADEETVHNIELVDDGDATAIWRLEEDEKMEKSDKAWQLHQVVAESRTIINEELTRMGLALCKFKEMNGWDALGYRSMREWCQDPDIDLRYDKAQRLIRITERLYLEAGVQPEEIKEIGVYKADRISQFHQDEDFDELVSIARGASRVDLDEEIKERKGEDTDNEEDEDEPPLYVQKLEQIVKVLKDEPENKQKIQLALSILNSQFESLTGMET